MKFLLYILVIISFNSFAECVWSKKYQILHSAELTFQECKKNNKIRINGIELTPNISFDIVHSGYPEGNTIWSEVSSDNETALVWLENTRYERNLWVIDLVRNSVELSISSLSEGKHFSAQFQDNEKFVITVAGMGYKKESHYQRVLGKWQK